MDEIGEMDGIEREVRELESVFTDETAEPIQISYPVIKYITKNFYQVIGSGGFGVVYLGALGNDLMVAVKELRISQEYSDTEFLREIKCLKRVKNKNIVRYLGYCAYANEVVMKVGGEDRLVDLPKRFICFKYAPNGNLSHYLQEKTYEYEWCVQYKMIKGICQGLHYLHQQRIAHLDLKPENVLLGDQMEPKITDFGLSRCNDGTKSIIFTKKVQGTPGYIPPELIDQGKITFKTDVYSLGIIIIRLLTRSNKDIPENWFESLNADNCQQMDTCIAIAKSCTVEESMRPKISCVINMLTETEAMMEHYVPRVIITEPRNDQTSDLYKIVRRFLDHRPEYYRSLERPKWKLAFHSPPKLPIITNEKIVDANGNPLEVILVDAETGKLSDVWRALDIELVPLASNFPPDCWDAYDFQRGILKNPEEGDHPLLDGDNKLTMWDGRSTVDKLMFTRDYQQYGCMFRIGVRIVPGCYSGLRILEAMTEAFMVRDRQSYELYSNKDYKWQLAFQTCPWLPIYVGNKITDVIGNPLEVILVDIETGSPSPLPIEELNIELVVLDDILSLPPVSERCTDAFQAGGPIFSGGKEILLSGDVRLVLKADGRAIANELELNCTGSSFRIGVQVVPGTYNGPGRILVGMTNSFEVHDKPSEKNYPPALGDKVWRLEHISWGGVVHQRLTQNNVRNVQDFLRMLAVKPEELRVITDAGTEDGDGTWEDIINHARTCVFPGDKVYTYSMTVATIYVNSIFDLIKVEFGGIDKECSIHQLDDAQKRLVHEAMLEAYEHRHSLQEITLTLKLAFKRQPQLPIHIGSRITDTTGDPLEIFIVDAKTGSPWALPMELYVQLVPLFGDFPPYVGKQDWSVEEFCAAIVKGRQGDYVPLLRGNTCCRMRGGRVVVDELLWFTDDSSWLSCLEFRIGACVLLHGHHDGSFRILEGMTEAFVVEDLDRKHYPPLPGDHVWRLEMIDRDGVVHRMLTTNNVDTVQEFCSMRNVKPNELRAIVGNGMTDEMWAVTTDHARQCYDGFKVYAFVGANFTMYVDSLFCTLWKIEVDGVESCPLWAMDDAQRMLLRQLILEAYESRHNLTVVDAFMSDKKPKSGLVIYELLHEEYKQKALLKLDTEEDDTEEEVLAPRAALVQDLLNQPSKSSCSIS